MAQGLLPDISPVTGEVTRKIQPSKTWWIDFQKNKMIGKTDGKEALEQAIYLMLETKRFEHVIYSWNYGHEITRCIGKSQGYIEAEYPRLIKECLEQDDRINEVSNFQFTAIEDGLKVTFDVQTAAGIIHVEREVR